MHFDKGINNFLQKKRVQSRKIIKAFLMHKSITLDLNNQPKVSIYLQSVFDEFATFVDTQIKQGKNLAKDHPNYQLP